MEGERLQGYVAGLEQTLKNTHLDLSEVMDQFQELCHRVAPESNFPVGIVTDIRKTYKEIQDQLTKIRGVNQLLEGKYRQYYRRDSRRDKEIMEFGFLAKNLYSKFECTLQEIKAKRKLTPFPGFNPGRIRSFSFEIYGVFTSWTIKPNPIWSASRDGRSFRMGFGVSPSSFCQERQHGLITSNLVCDCESMTSKSAIQGVNSVEL